MKKLIPLLTMLFFCTQIMAQAIVNGRVIDENDEPVVGANVYIRGIKKGASTNEQGRFELKNVPTGQYEVVVSYIGYQTETQQLQVPEGVQKRIAFFQIKPATATLEQLIVKSTRVGAREPFTYTNVNQEKIEKSNLGQDVPFLLRWTPSAVVTSDAGTGYGYTGIRVRGSDPSRINVTINGIPLNDSESQGVFWVDLPDFISSTADVQIQRGVGTSTNGAGAFGASINMSTSKIHEKAYASVSAAYGSFNTFKGNVQFGSGLLGDKFTIDGRVSKINSDGYIDRGSSDLLSYYLSAAFVGKKSLLRLNVFSGHEVTYQAWNGVPAQYVEDETLRTFNTAGMEKASEPHDNEVDDYTQTHYQVLFSQQITPNWDLNLAAHYTKGAGFFEQYKAGQDLADYNFVSETTIISDLVRRRWLDNDFFGGTYALTYTSTGRKVNATLGGAWNKYLGGHFGETIWTATFGEVPNPPYYYDNDATKTDFNIYTKINYTIVSPLNVYLDLQYRTINYEFLGFDNGGTNVTQDDQLGFFNPKAGLFFQPTDQFNLYGSFGVANREPNRSDYTESTPATRPSHETLYNTEIGFRQNWKKAALNVNFYHMLYDNQLVLTGKINDVGEYTRTNVADSYRAGVEIVGGFDIYKGLSFSGNATFSQNKIKSFTEYIDNWDTWGQETIEHTDTDLAFSPNVIMGTDLTYDVFKGRDSKRPQDLSISLLNKYVGAQFIDNTSNENTMLDPYFFTDLRINYATQFAFFKEVRFSFMIRNLFDSRFSSNAWTYRFTSEGYDPRPDDPYARLESGSTYNLTGFYPQAGRNFLLGVDLRF